MLNCLVNLIFHDFQNTLILLLTKLVSDNAENKKFLGITNTVLVTWLRTVLVLFLDAHISITNYAISFIN